MQIFTQLSPTVTKLGHRLLRLKIKCDHPACVSVNSGHFEHITCMVAELLYRVSLGITSSKLQVIE